MRPTLSMALLTSMIAGLSGIAVSQDTSKTPRGVHMQSSRLSPELVKTTQEETGKAVERGAQLWKDRLLGNNGQSCNMCHPGGAATHPETYPKFKQQFGRVVSAQEFINWCIVGAMHGESQPLGGETLTALEAYQAYMNRGQIMEIGVPGP